MKNFFDPWIGEKSGGLGGNFIVQGAARSFNKFCIINKGELRHVE